MDNEGMLDFNIVRDSPISARLDEVLNAILVSSFYTSSTITQKACLLLLPTDVPRSRERTRFICNQYKMVLYTGYVQYGNNLCSVTLEILWWFSSPCFLDLGQNSETVRPRIAQLRLDTKHCRARVLGVKRL
jgi:hypothetical protein